MRGERASRDSACVVDRGARSARMLGFWKGRNRRLPTAAARLRRPISREYLVVSSLLGLLTGFAAVPLSGTCLALRTATLATA
jgi:hypothetical protein